MRVRANTVGNVMFLAIIALIALGTTGWVLNVIKLVNLLHGDITAMFVARVIGVFAIPLGSVLGFL